MPKRAEHLDVTGRIGPLHDTLHGQVPEWPMYSFQAPSMAVWGGIAQRLHERGWSEKRIREWLQSKNARWAMDGALGDALADLATGYADKIADGGA